MKRKGMHRRRKLVLLAVSLIMVGIAVWRIWQTPRPTVLHRQDAWLSSAELEMVDTLPDNTFTAELPEEIDGRLLYIRDYSASGHYQIVWEDVSAEAAEAYLNALLDKGFTRLMGTAEDIASGVLLARGKVLPCREKMCYNGDTYDFRRSLMAKEKTLFACTACGYETSRWVGRCPGCGAWNTMVESAPIVTGAPAKAPKQRPGTGASAMLLREIPEDVAVRSSTGISELDRVLGGGIVEGALMLIGGDPGIGKSTLLLQVCANLCKTGKRVLYVSGEESAKQLKLRANRLGITSETLYVLAENALDNVEEKLRGLSPDVAVIDSIQTMYRPDMASAPGSVSQIRECTSQIMRLCKESGTAIFLVGHVTKDGAIAGPRMLEHMVDVVLYFEGDRQQEYRLLRAVKNRFGSVNELGVFQMTEAGMQIVPNPSEQLLSHRAKGASGSVVFCGLEGSRPLLCDVQALASTSYFGTPRRTVGGADTGRVALLLAVLEKRANQKTYNQDVYINVAGGLELSEPAADLALCMAVVSSLKDAAIGAEVAVMGEVGLAGEVRAIPQCDRRISECQRLGFTTILLPKENMRRLKAPEGMKLVGVDTVMQAISVLF